MANVSPERAGELISIMKSMYSITGSVLTSELSVFEQALITMAQSVDKEPSVYGAVSGLLYAVDSSRRTDAETAMRGYLMGSLEIKKKGAEFLKGLFCTARDIILSDNSFLQMTDGLITEMDYNDFLEILPSMKLAFSYFTPSEIQDTAESVAELHSVSKKDILNAQAVDENLFLFGEELDMEICKSIGI